jgi:SAM-dependent methyltransferase
VRALLTRGELVGLVSTISLPLSAVFDVLRLALRAPYYCQLKPASFWRRAFLPAVGHDSGAIEIRNHRARVELGHRPHRLRNLGPCKFNMRTQDDFDRFYATPDPWGIRRSRGRDRVLRRALSKYLRGRFVLELGCGEGHLTEAVFSEARSVTGIDISSVAIERAKARKLKNASFVCADFLDIPFGDYDVIAAIECLYYLSSEEQDATFEKIAREHRGRVIIISAPIIGLSVHRKYFTHSEILDQLDRRMMSLTEFHNLNLRTDARLWSFAAKVFNRLPGAQLLLDSMPMPLIYQRCYVAQTSARAAQPQPAVDIPSSVHSAYRRRIRN